MARHMTNQYAMYKGDELLVIGTAREIAEERNIKVRTVYFYSSPAHRKRRKKSKNAISVIRLEDD